MGKRTSTKKPDPKKGSVPLGKPLELTDADLDQLAQVTPEDIEKLKLEAAKHLTTKKKQGDDPTDPT